MSASRGIQFRENTPLHLIPIGFHWFPFRYWYSGFLVSNLDPVRVSVRSYKFQVTSCIQVWPTLWFRSIQLCRTGYPFPVCFSVSSKGCNQIARSDFVSISVSVCILYWKISSFKFELIQLEALPERLWNSSSGPNFEFKAS